jgi:hypothetical protein
MNRITKPLISVSALLLAFQAEAWGEKIDVGEMEYFSGCALVIGMRKEKDRTDQLKQHPLILTQLAKKRRRLSFECRLRKIDGRQEVSARHSRDADLGLSIRAARWTDQTFNRSLQISP